MRRLLITCGDLVRVARPVESQRQFARHASAAVDYSRAAPTDVASIEPMVNSLRGHFQAGLTQPLEFRRDQIEAIKRLVAENKDVLAEADRRDSGKHPAFSNRILGGCVHSCDVALDNLEAWATPQSLPSVGQNACQVRFIPRGVALVIGTWNFPNPLVWKPLISAIAAGNPVVLKLSEVCEASSRVMGDLATSYLDPRCVQVVQGDTNDLALVNDEILRQRYDVMFYTGNTKRGKGVMRAAAEHLAPCILELGGKNPVIVSADANIPVAARKIIDGRLSNAGQFCVAPDYVLCDRSVQKQLQDAMKTAIVSFFTENPQTCNSYGRIVNGGHVERLGELLKSDHGGKIIIGGNVDVADRYVAPTIVVDPKLDSDLVEEEMFGPILTVLGVENVDQAIAHVNARPSPLALYVFSTTQDTVDHVINSTQSGGACANDVIQQMQNEVLPFGGFGASGHGSYHGFYGFRAFSHEKAVMLVDAKDTGGSRFPPFE